MSIEKLPRNHGHVWRVRWRDTAGNPHSKVVGRKRDAELFDAEIKRAKRLGTLASVEGGKQSLEEFAQEWARLRAVHLELKTRRLYLYLLETHILPSLGSYQLRELATDGIARWYADMLAADVGPVAAGKALTLLGGILERACEWQRIPANPARHVRHAPVPPSRTVRPLPPSAVEALRSALGHRDATIVSVLAYSGLRPGERLALSWAHVRDRTLLVERAVSLGQIKTIKNRRRWRTIRLLSPLAADLGEWRLASRRPRPDTLVFPAAGVKPWSECMWRNWRRRVYAAPARAVGFDESRPYDLRHSYASLRIAEGANVLQVAQELGHDPRLTLSTYGHLFDEAAGVQGVSAEEAIRAARGESVSEKCPRADARRRNE